MVVIIVVMVVMVMVVLLFPCPSSSRCLVPPPLLSSLSPSFRLPIVLLSWPVVVVVVVVGVVIVVLMVIVMLVVVVVLVVAVVPVPLVMLPVSTPRAVARSAGWGCFCGPVSGHCASAHCYKSHPIRNEKYELVGLNKSVMHHSIWPCKICGVFTVNSKTGIHEKNKSSLMSSQCEKYPNPTFNLLLI